GVGGLEGWGRAFGGSAGGFAASGAAACGAGVVWVVPAAAGGMGAAGSPARTAQGMKSTPKVAARRPAQVDPILGSLPKLRGAPPRRHRRFGAPASLRADSPAASNSLKKSH